MPDLVLVEGALDFAVRVGVQGIQGILVGGNLRAKGGVGGSALRQVCGGGRLPLLLEELDLFQRLLLAGHHGFGQRDLVAQRGHFSRVGLVTVEVIVLCRFPRRPRGL